MRISIIGTGYVGLVTGISLTLLDHQVICVDSDIDKVSKIKKGQPTFYEKGLEESLEKVLKTGKFNITTDLEDAILKSDVTIISVGTPTLNNKIDLSFIEKVSQQIGVALSKKEKYHVVTVKSTVLPGVTQSVVKPIIEKYAGKLTGQFGLCMNPEFLREGNAMEDALNPDRIVIGQADEKSGKEFAKIYTEVSAPIIFTNLQTAEMIKYTANALFATMISFSNEIARISESIEKVDVVDVWKGVHLDKRLSPKKGNETIKPGLLSYLFSGCGFGGSCFPKDTKALASFAKDQEIEASLINSVININASQPHQLIMLLKDALEGNVKNKKIAILGLSFKPNTDDYRESAAFPIIEELLSDGAKVICHDPMVYKKVTPKELSTLSIVLAKDIKQAIQNADAVIIVTAWEDYIKLTPDFFKKNMKNPVVIDGRRIYDKSFFMQSGILYKGIGLGN